MPVRIEVIPWQKKAGQFGVAIARDGRAEAYFVGSRREAEREARRKRENARAQTEAIAVRTGK